MESRSRFRSLKIWESEDHKIIWQLSPIPANSKLPKKIFMTIDINQMTRGITFSRIKPKFNIKSGTLVQLLRKHLNGLVVQEITQNENTKDYRINVHGASRSVNWIILLHGTKPPEFELVNSDEQTSYFRWSTRGTYTKRKNYEVDSDKNPKGSFVDISSPLVQSILNAPDENLEEVDSPVSSISSLTQRNAVQKIRRRLRTLKKSLEKTLSKSIKTEDLDVWKKNTLLLEQYSYLIKKDADHLTLSPEQTRQDESLTIEIDPDKSIGENINHYHIKYKKMKTSISSQKKQIDQCKEDIQRVTRDLDQLLEYELTDDEVSHLLAQHKLTIKKKSSGATPSQNIRTPYKVYLSTDGTRILVGKGATENDVLTKKAKSNDFWIHAVGVTGSHVIVEGNKFRKELLPQSIFKDAAILALYFSKLKNDFSGEVYYTRKQHIKKSKGMPPGLWNVEHAPVAFIKYNEEELKSILNRQDVS